MNLDEAIAVARGCDAALTAARVCYARAKYAADNQGERAAWVAVNEAKSASVDAWGVVHEVGYRDLRAALRVCT